MTAPTTNVDRKVVAPPGPVDANYTQEQTVNATSGGTHSHVAGGCELFTGATLVLTAPAAGALAAARAAALPVPASVRNIASSTNANPIVITTSTAHGRTTGDVVSVGGHATNTNANGVLRAVTVLTPTTFSIPVAGNGVGGATGVVGLTSELLGLNWQVRDASTLTVTDSNGNVAVLAGMSATEGRALRIADVTSAGVVWVDY